jgi:site-specific recombinase XerD
VLSDNQSILVDLLEALGDNPADFTAHAIRAFVLERAKPHSRGRAKSIAVATRAFLRFLVAAGQCPVGRDYAVPGFANWQLASVPRFLAADDIDRAIAACEGEGRLRDNAPDLTTRLGVRDRAMMHLCFAAGLRVSELVGAMMANLSLQRPPSLLVQGKGRKEGCFPLWKETAADLRAWLTLRGFVRVPELFVNAEGAPMTRAGFEYVLEKHARAAAETCPSLRGRSTSPHQLRHSCAVIMLQATHDIRKVALWLGHADIRTTEVYLRMDPSEKAGSGGSGDADGSKPRTH